MNKKIVASGVKMQDQLELINQYQVTKGKLSDGKETVRLAADLVITVKNGISMNLTGVVIPPKGTSDGFHEALDSESLDVALANTEKLWNKVVSLMSSDFELFLHPEKVCEAVDAWGGWKEYGAQAALAVREMVFKMSAQFRGLTLEEAKHTAYKSVGGFNDMAFAIPQSVMLSAAKHGNGIEELETPEDRPWDASVSKVVKGLPWQEWMVQLAFARTPRELRVAGEKFHNILYWSLREKGDHVKKLSKEGGMTVNNTKTPYEIIDLYSEAVQRLGKELRRPLALGKDVFLAIDGATTECYFPELYIYDAAFKSELLKSISGPVKEDKDSNTVMLTRAQHWQYTEQVRAEKGKIMDFQTIGTYHTVFSEAEAQAYREFLLKKANDPAFKAKLPVAISEMDIDFDAAEIKDDELNNDGYRKFALTSFMQAMLALHLIETKGPVFSSIEDIMAEDDWKGYLLAFSVLENVQLVGDDFWVTNPARMVRFFRLAFDYMAKLSPADREKVSARFKFVPLIKENQVADPWKSILMISLSEHVHYLLHSGQFEFVKSVVDQNYDIDSVHGIKQMIAALDKKVDEIGRPTRPEINAVVSHRSKSFGADVDLALGLATGSTGKIGAISSGLPILEWLDQINPYEPALLTRTHKYEYAEQAVDDERNPTTFNQDSLPVKR